MKKETNNWDDEQRTYMWAQFADITGPYEDWTHPPHGKNGKTQNITATGVSVKDAKKEVLRRMKMKFPNNIYTIGSINNQIAYVIGKQTLSYFQNDGRRGNFVRNLVAAITVGFVTEIDLLCKHPNLIR
tara:strand:- start:286 stop:672 length:387 start_codon:yes stop_codon:yes gene_type:complete